MASDPAIGGAPPAPLVGRVALVTGASRGSGRAIAASLTRLGAEVILLARPSGHLQSAAADLRAVPLGADLTDPGAVKDAFTEVEQRFGKLDILVNNAAISGVHLIEETSDAELAAEVGTNLLGPMHTIRSAVPLLRKGTRPHIINVSSEVVRDPMPGIAVYAATKGALNVLTEALALELKPDGIRVTLLVSGRTDTSFSASWDPDRRAAIRERWAALGFTARVSGSAAQSPDTVARAVCSVLTHPEDSIMDIVSVRSFS
jgi:NAD(P)-dependent dehydrogenase (short-subunit alcohol dehydrogenase family)